MGKWHASEAVAALEADYDGMSWDHVYGDFADSATGWISTFVLYDDGRGHQLPVSRPYTQPIFMVKEAAEAGPAIDVYDWEWCAACRDGIGHLCGNWDCNAITTHMTGTLCPKCWSEPFTHDELPALRTRTE